MSWRPAYFALVLFAALTSVQAQEQIIDISPPETGEDSVGSAASPADERTILNPLSAVTLDRLQDFQGRPLFVASRRPPPPPPDPIAEEPEEDFEPADSDLVETPPQPVSPPKVPDVALSGIVEINATPFAVLRNQLEGKAVSVRVGDPLEEWTVAAIGTDSVKIEHDGVTHEFKIFQPGPKDGEVPPGMDPTMSLPPGMSPEDVLGGEEALPEFMRRRLRESGQLGPDGQPIVQNPPVSDTPEEPMGDDSADEDAGDEDLSGDEEVEDISLDEEDSLEEDGGEDDIYIEEGEEVEEGALDETESVEDIAE